MLECINYQNNHFDCPPVSKGMPNFNLYEKVMRTLNTRILISAFIVIGHFGGIDVSQCLRPRVGAQPGCQARRPSLRLQPRRIRQLPHDRKLEGTQKITS